jgi:hypothetical protein
VSHDGAIVPRVLASATVQAAIRRWRFEEWQACGAPALDGELERALGVALAGALPEERARGRAKRVLAARRAWTRDFGGDQFALGRPFYTHLETGMAEQYFRSVVESDACVERHLPGMQAEVRALFGRLVGGSARQRLGFAGAGVHVFPARGLVARRGGVTHWDVEGLAPLALSTTARAATLVIMLQPATWGGGLRLWDAVYDGHDEPSDAALASRAATHRYRAGDAILTSSYRLHQIRPFRGALDRISITLHGVEIDRGVWDTWF